MQTLDDAVCRAFVYLVQGKTTAGQSAVRAALDELVACTDERTVDTCMHRGAVVYDLVRWLPFPGQLGGWFKV